MVEEEYLEEEEYYISSERNSTALRQLASEMHISDTTAATLLAEGNRASLPAVLEKYVTPLTEFTHAHGEPDHGIDPFSEEHRITFDEGSEVTATRLPSKIAESFDYYSKQYPLTHKRCWVSTNTPREGLLVMIDWPTPNKKATVVFSCPSIGLETDRVAVDQLPVDAIRIIGGVVDSLLQRLDSSHIVPNRPSTHR